MGDQEIGASAGRKARLRAVIALCVFVAIGVAMFFLAPEDRYLWLKALHVIAVISWMAGMLYMPRLFIYHGDAEKGSLQAKTFAVMEQRLLKVIMTPAMVISWVLGLYLAYEGFSFSGGWLHLKILAVFILSGVHGYFASAVAAFGRDQYRGTARFWRLINEVPTILMILIVILVVVKPF
ncbi:MAG: protoporphyrinogen oxidase HemJ [Allorhizobium sp.]